MKKFLKILKWIGIALLILIAGIFIFVQAGSNKKFNAPYPDIVASSDSAMIARGEYLVYGPSHCASCHVPMDKIMAVENGERIPLTGGWEESFPGLGTLRAPNITPDPTTGIGGKSDPEIARSIRHLVASDGKMIFPFMNYQEMTDEDLTAIISFLRSQEPVHSAVEKTEYGFIGKALIAFGMLKPEGPKQTPEKSIVVDSTAAYGEYLARNVGNCRGCHIKMDNTGKQLNADFAGGGMFPPSSFSAGFAYVSPNLTPHKKSGILVNWSEEDFIIRFREGRLHKGSPMPWGLYSRMTDNDLKALYRFFQSLDPVDFEASKTVYAPGEELPK